MSDVSLVWTHPEKDGKQKAMALLLTLGFLLVILLFMFYNEIVQQNTLADIEEDMWTRFQPKKILNQKITKKKIKPSKEMQKAPKVSRMKLSVFKQSMLMNKRSASLSAVTHKKRSSTARLSLKTRNTSFSTRENAFDISRQNRNTFAISHATKGKKHNGSTIGLSTRGAGEGGNENSQRASLGAKGFRAGISARGTAAGGAVNVTMQELREMEKEFGDLGDLFKPLVEWMKLHPVKIPPILKRFMGYKPGNLTSRVRFVINGRDFDMALLCVEKTYEVRIALMEVNKNRVTYLIDQGFREQTNLIRYGSVNYDKFNGTIGQFGTSLKPAKGKRADEFYQIFLSWWNSVKEEVG